LGAGDVAAGRGETPLNRRHHLVLVARIESVDLVLDNLRAGLRGFADTLADYQWLRIQSSANPRFWHEVEITQG
jgi:predicted transglutaminase-like cysteine proteinase